MAFKYIDTDSEYRSFTSKRITDSLCKHVLSISSEKSKKVFEVSESIGYANTLWGYGYQEITDCAMNRACQLVTIERMIRKNQNNACRYVIDKNGVLWVDNLHTAIKWVWLKGDGAWLSSIPHYIIDMREDVPVVVNINGSLHDSVKDIENAILYACKRCTRVTPELYDINYTIGEFIKENELYRSL